MPVVLVQQADDLGGRQRSRQRGEVADVGEQHGQLLRVGRRGAVGAGLQLLRHRGREVAPQALALALLGDDAGDQRAHAADQMGGCRRRAAEHDHRRGPGAAADPRFALQQDLAHGGGDRDQQHLTRVERQRAQQDQQREQAEREARDAARRR